MHSASSLHSGRRNLENSSFGFDTTNAYAALPSLTMLKSFMLTMHQLHQPRHAFRSIVHFAGEKLRKGVHLVEVDTEVPPFFDTFDEYRDFCLDYRIALGKVARLTACLLPEQALAAASRRLSSALALCSVSGASVEVTLPPSSRRNLNTFWGPLLLAFISC